MGAIGYIVAGITQNNAKRGAIGSVGQYLVMYGHCKKFGKSAGMVVVA